MRSGRKLFLWNIDWLSTSSALQKCFSDRCTIDFAGMVCRGTLELCWFPFKAFWCCHGFGVVRGEIDWDEKCRCVKSIKWKSAFSYPSNGQSILFRWIPFSHASHSVRSINITARRVDQARLMMKTHPSHPRYRISVEPSSHVDRLPDTDPNSRLDSQKKSLSPWVFG